MKEDQRLLLRAFDVLRDVSLFRFLDAEVLQSMLAECTPWHWEKTDTIDYRTGTQYCYIIVSGRLKVTQVDPNTGRSIALFLLKEGDLYDLFSLLDDKEHVSFPIALDPVTALRIPVKRMREWMCEYPKFNAMFLPYLGAKMRELESFSESVVFHDTLTRISNLILKHVLPKEVVKDEHYYPVSLINNLSHESLSELIGSVRSVVSTQMHKLKDEEIIISKRGHLAVKDLEKLMKKSDFFNE
ncbi:MAG: hypothetical protein DSZ03_08425 [Sulfurimonas sp.]|nr:MAG: hypothetical protein DSZ03_08425 [Sulfurimonas sp.]